MTLTNGREKDTDGSDASCSYFRSRFSLLQRLPHVCATFMNGTRIRVSWCRDRVIARLKMEGRLRSKTQATSVSPTISTWITLQVEEMVELFLS